MQKISTSNSPNGQAGQNGSTAGAPKPRRILIVDDNVDAATTLADLLEMMGGVAQVAHDGNSAVRQLIAWPADIVLLDIGLPDISGYEVARQVRQLKDIAQPRLIALTGWGQDQDKKAASDAGFDEHWTKPVDPGRLEKLLGA